MKWSILISLLVAALAVGILCLCGPHSFGPGLRYIRNPMDSWPQESFLALDAFAAFLLLLSYFLYRALNWARLVLMSGCVPPQAFDTSPGHISQPSQPAVLAAPPAPVKAAPTLSPPRPSAPVPTYTVVVNDVPVTIPIRVP